MIRYISGDACKILESKADTQVPLILAHSCNSLGSWGGGIALAIRKLFPSSYRKYHDFCVERHADPSMTIGSTLLLPIDASDPGYVYGSGDKMLIACLFTSFAGGDNPDVIAHNTGLAIADLKKQLRNPSTCHLDEAKKILANFEGVNLTISMPKINAGIFGVPWELTEQKLKESGMEYEVYVL